MSTFNKPARLMNFPPVKENKIELNEFLEAAKGLVLLIDDLGRVFSALSYDMTNNILKIEKRNEKTKYNFMEDLLLDEHVKKEAVTADALLWLKRALYFFLVFFKCLIEDADKSENLQCAMVTAYKASLEPHHGWVTRQLFAIFKKTCPYRHVVLDILRKRMEVGDEVLIKLQEFCSPLDQNIRHINNFYDCHNLDISSKAP